MKYKDLIRTLQIAASHNGGLNAECTKMWAEHDKHGIEIKNITPAEARELAEMGWVLGSDAEFDEEDAEVWENPGDHTDERLLEVYNLYNGIYKFE